MVSEEVSLIGGTLVPSVLVWREAGGNLEEAPSLWVLGLFSAKED